MAIRKVIQAGDPILKKKNKQIKVYNSPLSKKLQKDLTATMKKVDLIGMASSQIGENHMIFVTLLEDTKARKIVNKDKLRIYINPKITYFSKKKNVIYEGCGSVGDNIFGPVSRPEEVEVVATDEKGQKFSLRANGILARVIQHEMDHLNGIEYLERVTENRKFVGKAYYRKYIKNSKLQLKNSKVTKKIYKRA